MKNLIVFFLAVGLLGFAGCADNLETLIQDDAFHEYEQKLDSVEKAYLDKQITYAEYLEQRREIEDEYARDVQPEREAVSDSGRIINNPMKDDSADQK